MEKVPCWVLTALLLVAATCTNNNEGLKADTNDSASDASHNEQNALSAGEPTEAYGIEPEEYISPDFTVCPNHPNHYLLNAGYYTSSALNKDVELNLTVFTTLEYDPIRKTFALSLDTKNGRTQIAKDSAKGSYIKKLF